MLATHALRTDPDGPGTRSALGPLELTIGFDKLRTTAHLVLNVSYISVRIDEVCDVIKKVSNKSFVATDIYNALESCSWAMKGTTVFYNAASNPWPISRCEFSETQQQVLTYPLEEHLLMGQMLKQQRCVHFLTSKWIELVASAHDGISGLPNYKTIVIKSASPDVGNYNFFESVTGLAPAMWFGFRTLEQCSYDYFCGFKNEIQITYTGTDYDASVVRANAAAGFPDIKQLYTATQLLHYYGYDFASQDVLPIAYKTNPFKMRDGNGDMPYADDEPLSKGGGGGGDDDDDDDDDDNAMGGGGGGGGDSSKPNPDDDEGDKENGAPQSAGGHWTAHGKDKLHNYVKGLSPHKALCKSPVFKDLREYLSGVDTTTQRNGKQPRL